MEQLHAKFAYTQIFAYNETWKSPYLVSYSLCNF